MKGMFPFLKCQVKCILYMTIDNIGIVGNE